jgi:hypothetical protein
MFVHGCIRCDAKCPKYCERMIQIVRMLGKDWMLFLILVITLRSISFLSSILIPCIIAKSANIKIHFHCMHGHTSAVRSSSGIDHDQHDDCNGNGTHTAVMSFASSILL